MCVGRSLRTNRAGADQLSAIVGGRVEVFDIAWWHGPSEVCCTCVERSSPPVAEDLAVVFPELLPSGLHRLLGDLGVRTVAVEQGEFGTLGCNVLTVRPGVVIVAAGNPRHPAQRWPRAGWRGPHTSRGERQIGVNGSGGPDLPSHGLFCATPLLASAANARSRRTVPVQGGDPPPRHLRGQGGMLDNVEDLLTDVITSRALIARSSPSSAACRSCSALAPGRRWSAC